MAGPGASQMRAFSVCRAERQVLARPLNAVTVN